MKRICKALITTLFAVAISLGMVGCAKEPVVAVIDGEKISAQLYRIFLLSTERGLEAIVPNIWEIDQIEGKKPEEFAKDRAITSITYYVAVEQKAKEVNISLSKDEKQEIKLSAEQSMESNKKFVEEYGIKDVHFEKFLEYGKLEEKVIDEIGKTYVPNNDEINTAKEALLDEGEFAKTATISHILFRNRNELGERLPSDKDQKVKEKAQSVLQKVLQGQDIAELAVIYSDDKTVSQNKGRYTFTKGEMETSIEDVVFNLAIEEEVYPELVETSMGYEIIQLETMEQVNLEVQETMAIERVQQEFMTSELTSLAESYDIEKTEEYHSIHIMNINDNIK